MKKLFVSLALMANVAAFAAAPITDGLSEAQISELRATADKMRTPEVKAQEVSKVVREEMTQWGQLGVGIGQAMIGAAKEIGVAANDFAKTPLGVVTTAIVVYKIIGQDLLGIVFGTVVFILGLYFGNRVMRLAYELKYEYKSTPVFWGMFTYDKRLLVSRTEARDGAASIIVGVLVMLAGVVIAGMFIF